MKPAPIVLALGLFCAACASTQWVREDATPAVLDRDLAECRRQAWLDSYSRTVFYGPAATIALQNAQGQVVAVNPYGPSSDPVLLEAQLTDRCMRQRGYRLAPVTPAK